MPKASKPGPKFALEAGTRNVLTEFNLSLCTTLLMCNAFLCSDLVVLQNERRRIRRNLEEIWASGAAFECEEAVESGSALEMQAGEVRFQGTATSVEPHEFGWRVEMEFSPLTPWSPARFLPRHLLHLPEQDTEAD